MLERSLVQSRGFRNTGPEGARTGFEFLLRLPNYRGMRASLADGVDVTVDGEQFPFAANRMIVQGKELTLEQLRDAVTLRWEIDQPAIVRVTKPGGLAVGVHEISVGVRIRQPYFPIEFQPSVITETRKATIVL
jgi:Domain of unknown function (DUF6379)